jgi:hypothetical protein
MKKVLTGIVFGVIYLVITAIMAWTLNPISDLVGMLLMFGNLALSIFIAYLIHKKIYLSQKNLKPFTVISIGVVVGVLLKLISNSIDGNFSLGILALIVVTMIYISREE